MSCPPSRGNYAFCGFQVRNTHNFFVLLFVWVGAVWWLTIGRRAARWLTPVFVSFDILSLLLQLVGAVRISDTQPTDLDASQKLNRGKDIALVGVTLQIVAFGFFTLVAVRFHLVSKRFKQQLAQRFQATPGNKYVTIEGNSRRFKPNWEAMLYALNTSCLLILVRSIFREVNFGQGKTGYTQTHEWW